MQTRIITRHGQQVEVPALVMKNVSNIVKYGLGFIIEQGKRCVNSDNECVYRGENGECCVIGCMLDDSEIEERYTIGNLANRGKVKIDDELSNVLWYMQIVHDEIKDDDFMMSILQGMKNFDIYKYL